MTQFIATIYTTADPEAKVRSIADVANHPHIATKRNALCVSYDGASFHTALFNPGATGPRYFRGTVAQPALEINDVPISLEDDVLTYDGKKYFPDLQATIGEFITKPVMRINVLVQTHAGYYLQSQNLLDGRSHHFLDGQLLKILSGQRARGSEEDDLIEVVVYSNHQYVVRGKHMDVSSETLTFDDLPATRLSEQDFNIHFADDLNSVTITPK